jgi:hypothetical protein
MNDVSRDPGELRSAHEASSPKCLRKIVAYPIDLFCASPSARTEETVPVQNGGSASVLSDLSITQRDAVYRLSPMPTADSAGVTGLEVAAGPRCPSMMRWKSRLPVVRSCLT